MDCQGYPKPGHTLVGQSLPALSVRHGKQVIVLKHTTPHAMATAGRVSGPVIQALRPIGQRHVDESIVVCLQGQLSVTALRHFLMLWETMRFS